MEAACGLALLLKEAWEHLRLLLAVTKCHINSSCENQVEWMNYILHAVHKLQRDGADICAITVWALFGSYDWNCLVIKTKGCYEPDVFDVSSGFPQPTALAKAIQDIARHKARLQVSYNKEGLLQ